MRKHNTEAILEEVKRIKANLLKQKRKFGFIDDGRGMRYVIPAMLMEIMDLTEGERYYNWFKKEFPDDICEPYMLLQWLLMFYYRKEFDRAARILKEIIHQNIHLVPMILDQPIKHIDGFWYASNYEDENYLSYEDINQMKYISEDFKEWLRNTYASEEYQIIVSKYIELRKELNKANELQIRKEILQKELDLFR